MAYKIFKAMNQCSKTDKEILEDGMRMDLARDFNNNINSYSVNVNMNYEFFVDVVINDMLAFKSNIPTKKLILYPYEDSPAILKQGDYINWKVNGSVSDWLIVGIDTQYSFNVRALISKCTNELKWINRYGEIISYPCVYNNAKTGSASDITRNNHIELVLKNRTLYVQKNEDTMSIREGDRFIMASNVFKIGHIDDYSMDGVLQFYMEQDQKNLELDNFELGIADCYRKDFIEPEININPDDLQITITPTTNAIRTGQTIDFAVETFVSEGNVVANNYNIQTLQSSTGSFNFSTDANVFSIKNNASSGTVMVEVEDLDLSISKIFEFNLVGLW